MTFKHKLSVRLAMIYNRVRGPLVVGRRILFDPLVVLIVLLAMMAVPGSAEGFSTSKRRSVRVVIRRLVTLATIVGGPIGAGYALLALWLLRGCGHAGALLLGGSVFWDPIRVPVHNERRKRYRRFLGYLATPCPAGCRACDGRRRVDTLHALEVLEVYVGCRGWRFYVAA